MSEETGFQPGGARSAGRGSGNRLAKIKSMSEETGVEFEED